MTEEEFTELYDGMYDRVYRYALMELRQVDVALDVANETFADAWAKRDRLGDTLAARSAFVYGMARIAVLQARQQFARKHHDHRFIEDYAVEPVGLGDIADGVAEADLSVRVLAGLTEEERHLFGLAFATPATPGEAAAAMDLKQSAYSMRIKRLLTKVETLVQLHSPDRSDREEAPS